ncbi:hypothetical protein [Sphingobacterium ginsenosidimutans]
MLKNVGAKGNSQDARKWFMEDGMQLSWLWIVLNTSLLTDR